MGVGEVGGDGGWQCNSHSMGSWAIQLEIYIVCHFMERFKSREGDGLRKGQGTITSHTFRGRIGQVHVLMIRIRVLGQTNINLTSSSRISLHISIWRTLIITNLTISKVWPICFQTQQTSSLHTIPTGKILTHLTFQTITPWTFKTEGRNTGTILQLTSTRWWKWITLSTWSTSRSIRTHLTIIRASQTISLVWV